MKGMASILVASSLLAMLSCALAWAPMSSFGKTRLAMVRQHKPCLETRSMSLSMKADSYDKAMLENPDDHITVVDGVPTIQYSPAETLAISESRYFIRKYMGSVLRALVSLHRLE